MYIYIYNLHVVRTFTWCFQSLVLFTQLSAAIFLSPPHRLNQISFSVRFLDAIFSEADILHE